MEQKQLFESIDFNSPWDSQPNSPFAAAIPHGLQCHNREDGTGNTQMFAVVAPNSVWQDTTITLGDITDEHSQTLVFIELDLPGVNWMSPTDVSHEELLVMLERDGQLPSAHPDGVLMSFADGGVQTLSHDVITPELLRALVSINGGEPIPAKLTGKPN